MVGGIREHIPRAKAVLDYKGISGIYREPKVELINGVETETIHRENGCIFKLDPMKVMFSSGNQGERMHMARVSNPDEVVLDMFAGIGQFTIPLAKYSKPRKVIAIEKNPTTYSYLSNNVELNGLTNVEAIRGDCRDECPQREADRVVMGYFEAEEYVPWALNAIKKNGVIHYHVVVKKDKLQKEAERLKLDIANQGYRVRITGLRVVKSYAPSRHHCVIDFSISQVCKEDYNILL